MKEFKIKFANEVKGNGPDDFVTFVEKGETKIINESILEELKAGKEIRIGVCVGHGMDASYSYTKNDLEPEYIETEVVIEYKTRKFRQSKK